MRNMEYAAYTIEGDHAVLYRLYGQGSVVDVPARIGGWNVEILADHLFAGEMSVLCPPERMSLAGWTGSSWEELDEESCFRLWHDLRDSDGQKMLAEQEKTDDSALAADPALPAGRKERILPKVLGELGKGALCGSRVEVIHIPEGVRQIGNYAFYGLYRLREISFPSSLQRIGCGLFNGCRKTCRLVFHLEDSDRYQIRENEIGSSQNDDDVTEKNQNLEYATGRNQVYSAYRDSNRKDGMNREQGFSEKDLTPPIMKEVLDSLSNETDAIVMKDGSELYRLRFPQYYEEGKENTPARIIEIIYHGTGHQYRNCFLSRVLQFDRYDEVFPLSAAQENPGTNVPLILNRLRSGPAPKQEVMLRYLEYLRQETQTVMEQILTEREFDPDQELLMLDREGFFTPEIIEESIQAASQRGCTQAVSCLMEIRSRRFPRKMKNRYEL